MAALALEPVTDNDRDWVANTVSRHFASTRVVSRGRMIHTEDLPGIVAWRDRERAGVLLFERVAGAIEVVVLIAEVPGLGVGAALLAEMARQAREAQAGRLWLVTTSNNVEAIAFYESQGWHCDVIHEGAVDEARKLKPEIPHADAKGRPIRDEWEFVKPL